MLNAEHARLGRAGALTICAVRAALVSEARRARRRRAGRSCRRSADGRHARPALPRSAPRCAARRRSCRTGSTSLGAYLHRTEFRLEQPPPAWTRRRSAGRSGAAMACARAFELRAQQAWAELDAVEAAYRTWPPFAQSAVATAPRYGDRRRRAERCGRELSQAVTQAMQQQARHGWRALLEVALTATDGPPGSPSAWSRRWSSIVAGPRRQRRRRRCQGRPRRAIAHRAGDRG